MSSGLSHVTLMVRDLDRMRQILEAALDARLVHEGDGRSRSREMFLTVGETWVAIIEGEGPSSPTYDHVAFRIEADEFDERLARLRDLGLEVEASRPRQPGEGRSIYFRDHDNHLIELHAGTLEERLTAYGDRGETS